LIHKICSFEHPDSAIEQIAGSCRLGSEAMPFTDATSSSNNEESLLLSALCRTDASAWCFLRTGNQGVSYFSRAFLELWRIKEGRFTTAPGLTISEAELAEALSLHGVDAEHFFSEVADRSHDGGPPILLVRQDSMRIHAEVSVLSSERQITGALIRFREVVEHNVLDVMLSKISEAHRRLAVLSPRERQILRGICDGRTNKAISIQANISEKTVEKHRSRIMQKLKLRSSAELFRLASQAMLLSDLQQPPAPEQLAAVPLTGADERS